MQLCRLEPPGTNPSALASYSPLISPMNSFMKLRWNHGGRKVCSETIQRGGKITKSALAVPEISEGDVRRKEIARIGEAVGPDRSKIGETEQCAVVLADVAAGYFVD